MTSAKGSLDFFKRECVVGIAFNVDRTYLGGQLAYGEGVTLVCSLLVVLIKVQIYLH